MDLKNIRLVTKGVRRMRLQKITAIAFFTVGTLVAGIARAEESKQLVEDEIKSRMAATYDMLFKKRFPPIDNLFELLEKGDSKSRRCAVHYLREVSGKREIVQKMNFDDLKSQWIKLLQHADPEVRGVTVQVLGLLYKENSEVAQLLYPLLDDEGQFKHDPGSFGKSGMLEAVIDALGLIGEKTSAFKILPYINVDNLSQRTSQAIIKIDNPNILPEIQKLLTHEKPRTRRGALSVLSGMKAKIFILDIYKMFYDEDFHVRLAAVSAVLTIGDQHAATQISALLNDGTSRVRQMAAEKLGKLGDLSVVDALVDCLLDTTVEDRGHISQVIRTLAKLGDRSSIAYIADRLKINEDLVGDAAQHLSNEYIAANAMADLLGLQEVWPREYKPKIHAAQTWWMGHKNDPEFKKKMVGE